jgi:phospholipid N-methyltransferase
VPSASWTVPPRTRDAPHTRDVAEHVLHLLSEMRIEGQVVKRHPRQLSPDEFAAIDTVLGALGGTWKGGRTQGHVFRPGVNVPALLEAVLTTGRYVSPRAFDFLETPRDLAEDLVWRAHVSEGERALEPSAGRGPIAEALRRRGADVTLVELVESNAVDLVSRLGFDRAHVHEGDFLEMRLADLGGRPFDVCVMNPPFATRPLVDVEHVMHAFGMLRAGGRLVAVMSSGVSFRREPKAAQFRIFLAEHEGTMEDLPPDTFKASGTNAKTVVVTVRATPATRAEARRAAILRNGGKPALDLLAPPVNDTGLTYDEWFSGATFGGRFQIDDGIARQAWREDYDGPDFMALWHRQGEPRKLKLERLP